MYTAVDRARVKLRNELRALHDTRWARALRWLRTNRMYSWQDCEVTQVGKDGFHYKDGKDVRPTFQPWLG